MLGSLARGTVLAVGLFLLTASCGDDERLGPQTADESLLPGTSSKPTPSSRPSTSSRPGQGSQPSRSDGQDDQTLDVCAAIAQILKSDGVAEALCARQTFGERGPQQRNPQQVQQCKQCAAIAQPLLGLVQRVSCPGPIEDCNSNQEQLLACAEEAGKRLPEQIGSCELVAPDIAQQQMFQNALTNVACAQVLLTCPAALNALLGGLDSSMSAGLPGRR